MRARKTDPPRLALAALVAVPLIVAACAAPRASAPRGPSVDRGPVERGPVERAPVDVTPIERSADATAPEAVVPEPDAPSARPPRDLRVQVDDGLVVFVDRQVVEIAAFTCLDAGWLEQVACTPGSREHEALVAVIPPPSAVHAAMLLAGFEHGAPGRWSYDDGEYTLSPPTGDAVEIDVRFERDGVTVTEPIRTWIRDHLGERPFPDRPWIFGGSHFRANPPGMDPGEHYVADFSGSVIGLVTFGDEVIGFQEVIADQVSVQPPEWEVDDTKVPPMATEVTIVIRRWDGPE